MAFNVAVLRLCAFIVALLLTDVTGAPLVDVATNHEKLPNVASLDVSGHLPENELLSTSAIVSDILETATNDFLDKSWENLLSRVPRSLSDPAIKVTIGDETATLLRTKMEQLNEALIVEVKNNNNAPKCGAIAVNKVASETAGDIPSYFYDVKCPDKCTGDGVGNRVFRTVGLEAVYFKKLTSDVKDQYQVGFRRQVLGCCLEENAKTPDQSDHPEKPPVLTKRR